MMWEWSAELAAEITTDLVDLEFLPISTNQERGVSKLGVRGRCTQHPWLSQVMRPTTLSPARGRTCWRHDEYCRNGMIRREEKESCICFSRSFPLEGALCWNSKREWNDGNPTCRVTRKS